MSLNTLVYISFILPGETEEVLPVYNEIMDFIEDKIGHPIPRERIDDPELFQKRVAALQAD